MLRKIAFMLLRLFCTVVFILSAGLVMFASLPVHAVTINEIPIPTANSEPRNISVGPELSAAGLTAPVTIKPGIAIFRSGEWYMKQPSSPQNGLADTLIGYGFPGDIPITGDWNGDGNPDIGVFSGGMWYLKYLYPTGGNNNNGTPDFSFGYGDPGDIPIVGDWNGSGHTSIGIFRQGLWYLKNTTVGVAPSGIADNSFAFGLPTDIPVTGDWNGDGITDIGVFRNGVWYLQDMSAGLQPSGIAGTVIDFGMPGDIPLTGDWSGTGKCGIGVFRNGTWYLKVLNGTASDNDGTADIVFDYGMPGDIPVVELSSKANITPETYTITASAESNGGISPSGLITVNRGDSRTFTITPSSGYSIASVLVDGTSVGTVSSYAFTNVTTNHTITATFKQLHVSTYTEAWSYTGPGLYNANVTLTRANNGPISVTVNSLSYYDGTYNVTVSGSSLTGTANVNSTSLTMSASGLLSASNLLSGECTVAFNGTASNGYATGTCSNYCPSVPYFTQNTCTGVKTSGSGITP